MKRFYIMLVFSFPYFLIASQSIMSPLEKSFYDETRGYISKTNMQTRIEQLSKIGILKKFSDICNNMNSEVVSLMTITQFGTVENPSISKYVVNNNEIIGIKVFYNYVPNKIDYRIIIRSISKYQIEQIQNKISKLECLQNKARKRKININNSDSIIIFNYNGIDGSFVITPKTFFAKNDCDFEDNLMSLRMYALSIIGLDNVESDLSSISDSSLQDKLREKSIARFKNINNALSYFLKDKKVYGLEEAIWMYFTSSKSSIDKYISIWVLQIEMSLNTNTELPISYLFQKEYLPFVQQISPKENILYAYIYYKYCVFQNNKEMAEVYLKELEQAGVDKKLLQKQN